MKYKNLNKKYKQSQFLMKKARSNRKIDKRK